ncbi:MAG: glycosyltransferase family 4 protein, partial [Terriglobia bacterium]
LRDPYLLYVGNLKPHKNIPCLTKAYAMLPKFHRDRIKLVIAGSGSSGVRELDRLGQALGVRQNLLFFSSVSDSLLRYLYAGAEVTVLPSIQEGFGLPVLESMACGTPVICSSTSSLPEVGGDAALYFDPHQPEDLAAKLLQVLDDPAQRSRMAAAGTVQAQKFSWDECSRKHAEVFRSVIFR